MSRKETKRIAAKKRKKEEEQSISTVVMRFSETLFPLFSRALPRASASRYRRRSAIKRREGISNGRRKVNVETVKRSLQPCPAGRSDEGEEHDRGRACPSANVRRRVLSQPLSWTGRSARCRERRTKINK